MTEKSREQQRQGKERSPRKRCRSVFRVLVVASRVEVGVTHSRWTPQFNCHSAPLGGEGRERSGERRTRHPLPGRAEAAVGSVHARDPLKKTRVWLGAFHSPVWRPARLRRRPRDARRVAGPTSLTTTITSTDNNTFVFCCRRSILIRPRRGP
jgi:hypothetical protein